MKKLMFAVVATAAVAAVAKTGVWTQRETLDGYSAYATADNWQEGVVPAITNSLDLSATNLVVTLAGDPPGLQVIDNPWTQEGGGDKVVLALNALVGGPKTEFDIWYANFCRPLLIRDPSRYLGAWAIPSDCQHGAASVMQLLSDAAWTSTVNRVKLSGRMGFRVPTGATAALEHPFGEGLFEVNRQYSGRLHVNTATAGTLDIRNSPFRVRGVGFLLPFAMKKVIFSMGFPRSSPARPSTSTPRPRTPSSATRRARCARGARCRARRFPPPPCRPSRA